MNNPGGFRNGRNCGSFLLSMYVRVRRHDLAASADRRPADRWAGLVSRVDPAPPADLKSHLEGQLIELEQIGGPETG